MEVISSAEEFFQRLADKLKLNDAGHRSASAKRRFRSELFLILLSQTPAPGCGVIGPGVCFF